MVPKVTERYLLIPSGIIGYHWVHLGTIGYHWLPLATIGYHWLPWLPLGTIGYHWVPFGTIPYHLLLFASIHYMTVLWQSSGAGASKVLCMLCYIIPLIDSYHILHFYNYYMAERWGVLGGGGLFVC